MYSQGICKGVNKDNFLTYLFLGLFKNDLNLKDHMASNDRITMIYGLRMKYKGVSVACFKIHEMP
jgi:hypothetical protein